MNVKAVEILNNKTTMIIMIEATQQGQMNISPIISCKHTFPLPLVMFVQVDVKSKVFNFYK